MNIFFLDWDPKLSAIFACNKHIIKMVIESTQLLYTVYHLNQPELLLNSQLTPYKITHKNHPCSKWIRENFSNFLWLLTLSWEYCKEYTYRYNKVHSCEKHILWMVHHLPTNLSYSSMTLPVQAMPEKYKCIDAVEAYRKYYIGEKLRFVKYTKREVPFWLKEYF
jgi:hypothetical protein